MVCADKKLAKLRSDIEAKEKPQSIESFKNEAGISRMLPCGHDNLSKMKDYSKSNMQCGGRNE